MNAYSLLLVVVLNKVLHGLAKVLAPVTDTAWVLVEVKVSLFPRQDPDEDPVTWVNVTHHASLEH